MRTARRGFLGLVAAAAAGTATSCGASPSIHRSASTHRSSGNRSAGSQAASPEPGRSPTDNPSDAGRSPGSTGARSGNPTTIENSRVGDPNWRISHPGRPQAIEGYADRVSVLPGEPISLYVSTSAPAYRIMAYRIGWYCGAGARLVWKSAQLTGHRQPTPGPSGPTRMVRASWQPSAKVDTTGWPEGCYLLRLDTADDSGQRYVPMTIRSAQVRDRTVIMNAQPTWQAYNGWGGYSLYNGPGGLSDRSLQVSFDRPYADNHGAGQFLAFEQPLVELAERLGLPLAYLAATDIAAQTSALAGARAVISLGHDEYWSPERRRMITAARDSGVNLAILGANCCYRRIRLARTPLGAGRVVICYKGDWNLDPGVRHGDPPTANYRDPPDAYPESLMNGVIYDGYPVDAPYVISEPRHWVLAGTGVRVGDSFPHLVGVEYDRVNPAYPTPRDIDVFAHSPVDCSGRWSFSDSAYYTVSSGAGVFATGTMRWIDALRAHGSAQPTHEHHIDDRTAQLVDTVTTTVLRAFSHGPAGRAHPAHGSVRRIYGRV